jgi:hypothetical protein
MNHKLGIRSFALDIDDALLYYPINNTAIRRTNMSTPSSDHRQYPRVPVERRLMVLFDFAGRGAAREAATVDLSRKGTRILTDIELAPGQAVDLLAKNRVNTVPSQVVWVGITRSEGVREIGLQFLHGALLA